MKTTLLFLTLLALSVFTVQARTVRLADYGTPDDNQDDSAGFQQAVTDLADSGGGTLVVGEGVWNVERGIDLANPATNVTSIRISGNKGATIRLALNEEGTFLKAGNAIQIELSGLVVVSKNSGQVYDGGYFLTANYADQTIIQNCNFFGLYMKYDFIKITNTDLIVEKTIFGGNAAPGAQIHAVNYRGVTVRDCSFADYANHLDTYYSKTPYNNGVWIKAENDVMPAANGSGSKAVTVTNTRFDEGAPAAISVRNAPFADISDIHVNVSALTTGHAIRLDNVKFTQIRLSEFGYAPGSRPAIIAINNSTFEAVGLRFGAGVYFADSERNIKIYREKCYECSVVNTSRSTVETPVVEASLAPDVKTPPVGKAASDTGTGKAAVDTVISKPRVKTLQ